MTVEALTYARTCKWGGGRARRLRRRARDLCGGCRARDLPRTQSLPLFPLLALLLARKC